MPTVKLEKQFNFPKGMIHLLADSDNGVELVDAETCLLSVDFPDAESRDAFFWFAASKLFEALIQGNDDMPKRLISRLRAIHEKGKVPSWKSKFERAIAGEATPRFRVLRIKARFKIKKQMLPTTSLITINKVGLRLKNGKHFALRMDDGDDFMNSFRGINLNDHRDEEVIQSRVIIVRPCFSSIFFANDYYPRDWSELYDAEVISVSPIFFDKEDFELPPEEIVESEIYVGQPQEDRWSAPDRFVYLGRGFDQSDITNEIPLNSFDARLG